MAETLLATSSQKFIWSKKYLKEYIRRTQFEPYMGDSPDSVFQTVWETGQAGKGINIPLITRLKGTGVTGSQILIGSEEDLANYNAQVTLEWRRNGVRVPKSTSYLTEIDLFDAAKPMLRNWSAEALRDDLVQALGSIIIPGATGVQDTVVNYGDASTGQKDTYTVNNVDRLLFGVTKSNYSATHATALATIDNTADKMSTVVGSLAKRMAKAADPHIAPWKGEDGQEFYVMFCGSRAFRDLKLDTAILSANRDARPRNVESNPLFQDGDQIYDGVIYHEVQELDSLIVSSGIEVQQNFLCGRQAVGIAYGQMPTPRQDLTYDYSFRPGAAIEELRGQRKLSFNGIQFAVVTVFTAGVAD